MTSILLVSGSARTGSTNVAVLRTAAAFAPPGVDAMLFGGLAELSLYTPDRDREGAAVDARVMDLRTSIRRADALLICTPEYAGALPAAMKNLLEWTIGDGCTDGLAVAWINAAGPAAPTGGADAHDSLRKVLTYTGAGVVEEACRRVPITRDMVGDDGLVSDDSARAAIAAAIGVLAAAAVLGPSGARAGSPRAGQHTRV